MRKIDLIELTLQRIKYPCMIKTNFFLYKKYTCCITVALLCKTIILV